MILSSIRMTRLSLASIRAGEHGLNAHRRNLLDRVPNISDWARFPRDTVLNRDLAYLSAATGHEFAILIRAKSFRSRHRTI